jgi:hypothetical protein
MTEKQEASGPLVPGPNQTQASMKRKIPLVRLVLPCFLLDVWSWELFSDGECSLRQLSVCHLKRRRSNRVQQGSNRPKLTCMVARRRTSPQSPRIMAPMPSMVGPVLDMISTDPPTLDDAWHLNVPPTCELVINKIILLIWKCGQAMAAKGGYDYDALVEETALDMVCLALMFFFRSVYHS